MKVLDMWNFALCLAFFHEKNSFKPNAPSEYSIHPEVRWVYRSQSCFVRAPGMQVTPERKGVHAALA
jgi:hypothetical protein